jgi:precorrin-6B methylase 1
MAGAVIGALENESRDGDVTLLVSGDPGFYSLAKKVTGHFGRERVRIIPGISSLQLMAARLGKSWVGTSSLTLHGRSFPDISSVVDKLISSAALAVLLGAPGDVPVQLKWLSSDAELSSSKAALGWDLGLPGEKIFEAGELKNLPGGDYDGRLALLWLEKRGGTEDAG